MTLTAVGRDGALRITRTVESEEQLTAGRLSPASGRHLVGLGSLAEVEAFLVPMTAEDIIESGMRGSINHVEPRSLALWVRETIGDPELADSLDALVDSGRVFGLLVPEMKGLLAERLAQCHAVLGED
jgi:hypothetical protein